jgi:hypothetical protein
MNTPLVLMIFNRPDLTQAVFSSIAKTKPKQLFVIADGPRSPTEEEKCLQARSIVEMIDWKCDVRTNLSKTNMGCRHRIVSGLNWVFSLVDEAIILEDDCVPHESFFRYCATLLEYYRDNNRVMEIGGCNYRKRRINGRSSYYFSRYYHTLGWATWRRAWKFYDENIAMWPQVKCSEWWESFFEDKEERAYWNSIYDQIYNGELQSSWDYQWQFARWCQNGLAAVSTVNLISNIGFGSDATNTTCEHDFRARLPVSDIGQIEHPVSIERNTDADYHRFHTVELLNPGIFWQVGSRISRIARAFT